MNDKVRLSSKSGPELLLHRNFWQNALHVAEEYGEWKPRFNQRGQFSRRSTALRLGVELLVVNFGLYQELARFLIRHRDIRIT